MASKQIRTALTLPDDLREDLSAWAASMDKPMASAIVDLLREMQPQLQALTKMQLQLKSGKISAAKQTLRHMMGDQLAEVIADSQPELFSKGKRK